MSKIIRTNEITDSTLHWYVNDGNFQWVSSNDGEMTGTVSENSSFPPTNVLDLHPKKITKAGSNDVVLSFAVGGTSNAISMINTNATSATIKFVDKTTGDQAEDPLTGDPIEDIIVDLKGATTYEQYITDKGKPNQREFFRTYPKIYAPHIINIYLSGPSDLPVISCGVAVVGEYEEVNLLLHGLVQTFKDYSEVRELNTGATYTLPRDMVRIFNLTYEQCLSSGEIERLKEIFLSIGPNPIPWLIADDNDEMWVVFARKNAELNNNFYAFNRAKSTFSLIEVL